MTNPPEPPVIDGRLTDEQIISIYRFVNNECFTGTAQRFEIAFARAIEAAGAHPFEGWKLVPIEPTKEMLRAAFELPDIDGYPTGNDARRAVYLAMLAAAPAAGAHPSGAALASEPAPYTPQPNTGTHAFKNFHRLLCERFDYRHDEQDWPRDQLSLIEHIARTTAAGAHRLTEAEETIAQLSRALREAVEGPSLTALIRPHILTASECPPGSRVVLVSSLLRLTTETAAGAHRAEPLREAQRLLREGRQKLATYVSVYPGDKELRRLLSEWDAALSSVSPKGDKE